VGYIFAADSIGSIFFQIFVASSERRLIDIAECVMTLQGHPRSMIFVSSEKAYAINSNLGPISHRFWGAAIYWLKKANFLPPHLCSTPKFEDVPFAVCTRSLKFCTRRAETLG